MKTLIFDFDGTLFESSTGIYQSFVYSCVKHHLTPPDKTVFANHIGPPVGTIVDNFFPSLQDLLRSEFIRSFREHYDSIGYKDSYPYDGVSSLLQDIIYSPLYTNPSIVTNKPTSPTVSLLHEFNLHHFFDHIIGIDYLLSSSNDRTFANKSDAIKYLVSITQPSCDYLYIGDTISDMESASLAGCDFLAVGYGYTNWDTSHKSPPSYVCSVNQLKQFLHC